MTEQEIVAELLAMTQADTHPHGDENRSPFLEVNNTRVKELGQHLFELGGVSLMQEAFSQMPKCDQSELDCAWNKIGDWLW